MRSCQRCPYFLCGLAVCVVAAGIAAVGLLVGATFLFRPRWRYCSRVTGLPLQRREECVCLCSASSINMKIFTRVTRFVTLRNLFVSHELLVTSSESVDVTTSINSAGSPSDIRRYSDQKCIHVTCLSHASLSPLYLFFFRCSRNQSESARDMTSQPG